VTELCVTSIAVASAAFNLRRASRLSRLRSAFNLRCDSFTLRTMFNLGYSATCYSTQLAISA